MRQALAGNGIQTYVATEYQGFDTEKCDIETWETIFMFIDVTGHYFHDRSIAFSVGLGRVLSLSRDCFAPRHNILSNVRTNVRKYIVTWLEHSRGKY